MFVCKRQDQSENKSYTRYQSANHDDQNMV